jgi:hypothetical protein
MTHISKDQVDYLNNNDMPKDNNINLNLLPVNFLIIHYPDG